MFSSGSKSFNEVPAKLQRSSFLNFPRGVGSNITIGSMKGKSVGGMDRNADLKYSYVLEYLKVLNGKIPNIRIFLNHPFQRLV